MKRYSLKTMLLLVTVVGLFLGYAHCRKAKLVRECREAIADGANLTVPEAILWPSVPEEALIEFEMIPTETGLTAYQNGGKIFSRKGAIKHFDRLKSRLDQLGVENVTAIMKVSLGGKSMCFALNSMERLPKP